MQGSFDACVQCITKYKIISREAQKKGKQAPGEVWETRLVDCSISPEDSFKAVKKKIIKIFIDQEFSVLKTKVDTSGLQFSRLSVKLLHSNSILLPDSGRQKCKDWKIAPPCDFGITVSGLAVCAGDRYSQSLQEDLERHIS